ncbi:MAG: glycerate kinase [Candidatus Omnitrophota bacterium]
MKIVLAPNAFKECLSAPEAAAAMARGVLQARGDIDAVCVPLADGGDGTTEALVAARTGDWIEMTASDPLGRPVAVKYGLIDGGKTAVMEMAAASGLWRLTEAEKNPLNTSTRGTGEMMRDALDRGVETIVIGIGGSATTDGGAGMAAALGYRLLDGAGAIVESTGRGMAAVRRIDASSVHAQLKKVEILVASDVTNPLLGPEGAAAVYGPQKGATTEIIPLLEDGLANLAALWEKDMGATIGAMPGGGAAGGLGAGLAAFCGAEIRSGFDLIADYARLNEALDGASLAFTGEGKIDDSTRFGKVPAGVARRAKQKGVPAVVLGGSLCGDLSILHEAGIIAYFSLAPGPITLKEAIENARNHLERTAEQAMRLWLCRS